MLQAIDPSALGRLAFLHGFTPEQLGQLAALAAPVHWKANHVIFREGSRSAHLYVVREGRVAIQVAMHARNRVTILTLGPGDVFGWSSLFSDSPKSASARTVTATEAYAFDAPRLRALCDADPTFGYAVARRLLFAVSERLKGTRMQLLDLFANPAQYIESNGGAS